MFTEYYVLLRNGREIYRYTDKKRIKDAYDRECNAFPNDLYEVVVLTSHIVFTNRK